MSVNPAGDPAIGLVPDAALGWRNPNNSNSALHIAVLQGVTPQLAILRILIGNF